MVGFCQESCTIGYINSLICSSSTLMMHWKNVISDSDKYAIFATDGCKNIFASHLKSTFTHIISDTYIWRKRANPFSIWMSDVRKDIFIVKLDNMFRSKVMYRVYISFKCTEFKIHYYETEIVCIRKLLIIRCKTSTLFAPNELNLDLAERHQMS